MNLSTQELESELRRRKEKHNIKIAETVFALDFDEMRAILDQIGPILKTFEPKTTMRGFDLSHLIKTKL